MPFSEFLEWLEYLRQEEQRDTKAHWYQAQIAAELRRALVKDPNDVKVADFLLRFAPAMPPEVEAQVQKSKSAWASFLQVDVNKKN